MGDVPPIIDLVFEAVVLEFALHLCGNDLSFFLVGGLAPLIEVKLVGSLGWVRHRRARDYDRMGVEDVVVVLVKPVKDIDLTIDPVELP